MSKIYDHEQDPSIAQEFSESKNVHDLDSDSDRSDLLALPNALGFDIKPDLYVIKGDHTNDRTLKEKLLIASPVLILGSLAAVQVVKAL